MIKCIVRLFELILISLCHVIATSQWMPLNSQHVLWPLSNSPGDVLVIV